jgi:hypothetical protein
MNVRENDQISQIEQELNKNIPISNRWKRFILEEFKRQVNQLEELEELSALLQAWSFFIRPSDWLWETINMLDRYGAQSSYFLSINHIFDTGIESAEIGKKEEKKFAQRFRRALHRLFNAGIVTAIHFSPEEVGFGRRSVTIWISPFAKGHQIEKMKQFYTSVGGILSKATKKAVKKSPKDVVEHNLKVQAYHTLYKYTRHPQMYDYYKCPKKHADGVKRTQKTNIRWKKQKRNPECPKCNKKLEEIPYEEFIKLKEKVLLNPKKSKI